MDSYNIIIEVHHQVLAESEDDANQQAQRMRESIEAHHGAASVYIESVEKEA